MKKYSRILNCSTSLRNGSTINESTNSRFMQFGCFIIFSIAHAHFRHGILSLSIAFLYTPNNRNITQRRISFGKFYAAAVHDDKLEWKMMKRRNRNYEISIL